MKSNLNGNIRGFCREGSSGFSLLWVHYALLRNLRRHQQVRFGFLSGKKKRKKVIMISNGPRDERPSKDPKA